MRLPVLAFACVALAGSAHAESWTNFQDPNGVFSIAFPGNPAVSNAQTDVGNGAKVPMAVYNTTYGGTQFVVIDTNLSGYKVDAASAVESAAAGTRKAAADIKVDSPLHADGQNGRALTVIDKNGNRVLDHIFFVRGHLYQVMATAPANSPEADGQHFVDSFRFAP
ncbi:MAG TPA: hypothetical protein VGM17_00440 [Rhizomicrobium sp.]|jgi:hypothetical protein